MNMAKVKNTRKYDSSSRREQARRNRDAILDVARREFLAAGYEATTVAAIADKAGVSVETVYKGFGGKPGLARAIWERGLAGLGPVPAYARSDEMSAHEADPRVIVRNWGALAAEVSPLVSPILLLVRAAAATDPALATMLEGVDQQRLARMRHNARMLAKRGFLRDGVTVEKAADLMWTLTSPEVFELLVVRRGWTPSQLGELMASTMAAALVAPGRRGRGRRTP
jgi:AcrR family transcriptional regulator